MMKSTLAAMVACLALAGNSAVSVVQAQTLRVAVATIYGTADNAGVSGQYIFTQADAGQEVQINVTLRGMPLGLYASHVHTFGDINTGVTAGVNVDTSATGMGVGSHFNPYGQHHDCSPNVTRHVGDIIGTLDVTDSTVWTASYTRDLIELGLDSLASIVGRGVIVHSSYDRCLEAQSAGGAGVAKAQGVIGIADPSKYGFTGVTANAAAIALATNPNSAIARLHPTVATAMTYPSLSGTVQFGYDATKNLVRVVLNATGFPASSVHGFHVHTFGDDAGTDGTWAGGHYNPLGADHGLPPSANRHMGDMGNVTSDADGNIFADQWFDLLVLSPAAQLGSPPASFANILGRGLVLHAGYDNGTGPVGFAGGRLAVGVIGVSNRLMPAIVDASSSTGAADMASSSTGDVAPAASSSTGDAAAASSSAAAAASSSTAAAAAGASSSSTAAVAGSSSTGAIVIVGSSSTGAAVVASSSSGPSGGAGSSTADSHMGAASSTAAVSGLVTLAAALFATIVAAL